MSIRVGDSAPLFETQDSHGRDVRLADFHGKSNVVLFFYPKSFTPGCTAEVCAFRDAYSELQAHDTVLLGVSRDPADVQQRFVQDFQLPFSLLSDFDQRISKAYEATGLLGLLLSTTKRITFVIDKGGIVRGVFRHELNIGRHLIEVRRTLKTLQP